MCVRGVAVRAVAVRGVGVRGMGVRGMAVRVMAVRGMAVRAMAVRAMAVRPMAVVSHGTTRLLSQAALYSRGGDRRSSRLSNLPVRACKQCQYLRPKGTLQSSALGAGRANIKSEIKRAPMERNERT